MNGDSNLISENIKQNISIFGVSGNLSSREIIVSTGNQITFTSSTSASFPISTPNSIQSYYFHLYYKYGYVPSSFFSGSKYAEISIFYNYNNGNVYDYSNATYLFFEGNY